MLLRLAQCNTPGLTTKPIDIRTHDDLSMALQSPFNWSVFADTDKL